MILLIFAFNITTSDEVSYQTAKVAEWILSCKGIWKNITRSDSHFASTIMADVKANDISITDKTLTHYLTALRRLFVIEGAAANLITLSQTVDTSKIGEPSFLMVLTAGQYAYRREDGVYIVPIGCLKD